MKFYRFILAGLIFIAISSCTTEKMFFEKDNWWFGHWQNTSDTSSFFSGGNIRVHQSEKGIIRYYFYTKDTISHQHLIVELVEFNYKKKWKLMKTEDEKFIKVQEIDPSTIEVSGPVARTEDLYDHTGIYIKLPDDSPDKPFDDNILRGT